MPNLYNYPAPTIRQPKPQPAQQASSGASGSFPSVLGTSPQALFAAHGFNDNTWRGGNPGSSYVKQRFIPGQANIVGQGIDQANALMPVRENMIQQALALLSSGNQTAIDRQRQTELESAREKARQISVLMADQGQGSGNIQGQEAGAISEANKNTNTFAAQINSPEARQQMIQAIMALVQAGIQIPGLEEFMAMSGLAENTLHRPQTSQGGLMSAIAPYVGQAAGSWAGGQIFGGGQPA